MPSSDHPVFVPPSDPSAKIWRYMDFTKFVSMLENQGLFFSRADKLGDPFEGSFPKSNVTAQKMQYDAIGRPEMAAKSLAVSNYFTKWFVINCWHLNEHESAAMWSLYTKTNEAISVCSTYQKLRDVLDKRCYVGKVNYIDYGTADIPPNNHFYRFVNKRLSYAHENELRAVDMEVDKMPGNIDADRPTGGTWEYLNLQELIDSVHVAPTSPSWFKELVEQTVRRYSLNKPVIRSSLDDEPFS